MAVTDYCVIDGEIVSEIRNGTERDYVPDPLGSTVALLDNTQSKTDTFSYWPYGEVRTSTGSNVTPFRLVGTLGYYKDTTSRTYVRAREYQQNYGRWMTVDPLWPKQRTYAYSGNSPLTNADPSGYLTILGCGPEVRKYLNKVCTNVRGFLNKPPWVDRINRCIRDLSEGNDVPCPLLDAVKIRRMQDWCTNGRVECYRRGGIPDQPTVGGWAGEPGRVQIAPGGSPYRGGEAQQDIWTKGNYYGNRERMDMLAVTMLHEMAHKCNVPHGKEEPEHYNIQCNDFWAWCIYWHTWKGH